MILFEVTLAGLLVSLLTGGSLRRLKSERLVGEWLLLVLLPTQLMWPRLTGLLGIRCEASIIVWLLLMAGLAVVLMLNGARHWVLALAALGISANILVIGLNGGMPVSIRAASEVGGSREATRAALDADCLHEELDDETALPVLADIIGIPGPRWQRGVLSVGDLLLSVGLSGWVFRATRVNT